MLTDYSQTYDKKNPKPTDLRTYRSPNPGVEAMAGSIKEPSRASFFDIMRDSAAAAIMLSPESAGIHTLIGQRASLESMKDGRPVEMVSVKELKDVYNLDLKEPMPLQEALVFSELKRKEEAASAQWAEHAFNKNPISFLTAWATMGLVYGAMPSSLLSIGFVSKLARLKKLSLSAKQVHTSSQLIKSKAALETAKNARAAAGATKNMSLALSAADDVGRVLPAAKVGVLGLGTANLMENIAHHKITSARGHDYDIATPLAMGFFAPVLLKGAGQVLKGTSTATGRFFSRKATDAATSITNGVDNIRNIPRAAVGYARDKVKVKFNEAKGPVKDAISKELGDFKIRAGKLSGKTKDGMDSFFNRLKDVEMEDVLGKVRSAGEYLKGYYDEVSFPKDLDVKAGAAGAKVGRAVKKTAEALKKELDDIKESEMGAAIDKAIRKVRNVVEEDTGSHDLSKKLTSRYSKKLLDPEVERGLGPSFTPRTVVGEVQRLKKLPKPTASEKELMQHLEAVDTLGQSFKGAGIKVKKMLLDFHKSTMDMGSDVGILQAYPFLANKAATLAKMKEAVGRAVGDVAEMTPAQRRQVFAKMFSKNADEVDALLKSSNKGVKETNIKEAVAPVDEMSVMRNNLDEASGSKDPFVKATGTAASDMRKAMQNFSNCLLGKGA